MYKYIKENRVKATALVVAILLIVSTFIGAAVYSKGFTQWGKGSGSGIINGDTNIEFDSDKVQELPNSIVATSESSESITFNATVKPDDSYDKSLAWALTWTNTSDEWATGKTTTDYVSMTVGTTDSTHVTIACIEAFDEQMIMTATSVTNPSIKATATIDYMRSAVVSGMDLTYGDTSGDISKKDVKLTPVLSVKEGDIDKSINDQAVVFTPSFDYGIGTVNPDITSSMKVGLSDEFYRLGMGDDTAIAPRIVVVNNAFIFNEELFAKILGFSFEDMGVKNTEEFLKQFFYLSNKMPRLEKDHFQINFRYSVNGKAAIEEEYLFSFDVASFIYLVQTVVESIEMGPAVIL